MTEAVGEMDFSVINGNGRLTLSGSLTLDRVARLKAGLIEAFGRSERVELNLESVAQVDVAGLQIICAGHRFAAGRGKSLQLSGISEAVSEMARRAGVRRETLCRSACGDGTCLWSELAGEPGTSEKGAGGEA